MFFIGDTCLQKDDKLQKCGNGCQNEFLVACFDSAVALTFDHGADIHTLYITSDSCFVFNDRLLNLSCVFWYFFIILMGLWQNMVIF